MTRERTLTRLDLIPVSYSDRGDPWVQARWERSDGSGGRATARFRLKTAERWYIAELRVALPTAELLRDVPLARIEAAVNADPKIREWIEAGTPEDVIRRARRARAQRPRLERPSSRRLDDGFYKRVAAAYTGAVAHGLRPAKTLAADSDTPAGTVNRWIAGARSRGYLSPAEPGKVTV